MRLFNLVYILCIISISYGYYGPTEKDYKLTLGVNPVAFQVENKAYIFGGLQQSEQDFSVLTTFSIENNMMNSNILPMEPTGYSCYFCNGFVLNNTHVLIYNGYSTVPSLPDGTNNSNNMGFLYYNVLENFHVRQNDFKSILNSPLQRYFQSSVITPDNTAVYIFGGMNAYQNASYEMPIIRFDIITLTYTLYANMTMLGGTATMLPSGVVVIAFGSNNIKAVINNALYDTSNVFLFDTKTNVLSTQTVSGKLPDKRAESTGTLGPDKECIYYFGGNNFDINVTLSNWEAPFDYTYVRLFSDLVVLNTSSWTWFIPTITGPPSVARYGAFSLLYTDNRLIIGGGSLGNLYLQDISVLKNLPSSGQSIEAANLQWFTDSSLDYAYYPTEALSTREIIGICIGIVAFVIICVALLWKFVHLFKKAVLYIQYDIIWKPRTGEPFWAESSRLIIRFILFICFVAFVVYAIIRAVASPSQFQVETNIVNTMPVPDIRICSQSFNGDTTLPFNVNCQLANGTDCSQHFYTLNRSNFNPSFNAISSQPSCQLFIPPPGFSFQKNEGTYSNQFADSLSIRVLSQDPTQPVSLYVTYYSPGYDPNRKVYDLFPENEKLSDSDIVNWMTTEWSAHLIPNTFGCDAYTYTTATYSLEQVERLTGTGWNNIGFAYERTQKLELTQHVGPLVQGPASSITSVPAILVLTVRPSEFEINKTKEIKSSTVLSGFAQAGGVFGLFVAIQTLLFGFRPDSPWGLVHRWSFGKLKRTLANRLTSQFDRLKTPVPIVSPVHHRFRASNPLFENIPFIIPMQEENEDTDNARIRRMEERLQLMELLFKSYYINDEVFRHLDRAIKEKEMSIRSDERALDSRSSIDEEVPRNDTPIKME